MPIIAQLKWETYSIAKAINRGHTQSNDTGTTHVGLFNQKKQCSDVHYHRANRREGASLEK